MKNMRLLKKFAPFLGRNAESPESGLENNQASTIPFFTNIPEYALVNLMEKTKTLNYVKKTDFGFEHIKANHFFVIFYGNVTVFSPSDGSHNSKAAALQVQEPRLGIGKAMLITEEISSFFELSLEKVLYGFIPKNDFFGWMVSYPDVKFTLLNLFNES